MIVTDEMLMAYVDGELDADARASVEAAVARDPELARRVARQQDLRRQLRAAFDGVLQEPIPDRLLDAARHAPSQAGQANVADLARARTQRTERAERRWAWPEWGAIAASVVLGALLSQALWRPMGSEPIVARNGRLLANNQLARALSNQLSAAQPLDARIAMGLSFRAKSGEYCRTFVIRDGSGLAGLACREGEAWAVQTFVPGAHPPARDDRYAMAGAELPLLILQAVEERIAGEPLDADGEAAARDQHWR
jgi:hypothetical protein